MFNYISSYITSDPLSKTSYILDDIISSNPSIFDIYIGHNKSLKPNENTKTSLNEYIKKNYVTIFKSKYNKINYNLHNLSKCGLNTLTKSKKLRHPNLLQVSIFIF